jgi:hypothetical protein
VGQQEKIMKILYAAAFAASTILIPLAASPAIAQQISAVPELTCRVALEGRPFVEIEQENALSCCYVTEELAWYQEKDVLLNRFYEQEGPTVYYTVDQCRLDLDGVGIVASSPGIDDTPTGSIPDPTVDPVDPVDPADPIDGNPGNVKDVGNSGETPNDSGDWVPSPGETGQSD